MISNISKSAGTFFVLLLCLMIFQNAKSHAQANGFVFSKEDTMLYMYRFSLDGPAQLRERKPVYRWFAGYMLFANRPWLLCIHGSRLGYLLARVDTATGEEMPYDVTGLEYGDWKGASYDKSSNSLFIMRAVIAGHRGFRGKPGIYLERVNLGWKGCRHEDPVEVKDTTEPVTFTIGKDGFGYSINKRGVLRKINLATGSCEVILKLKSKIKGTINYSCFNPVNGKFYLLVNPDTLHTELTEVDIKSGQCKIAARWNGAYTFLAISGDVYPPPLAAPELIYPLGHLEDFEPLMQWKPVDGASGYYVNYRMIYDGVDHPWWKWNDVKEPFYKIQKGEFESSFPNFWWVAAYDSTGPGYFAKSGPTGYYVGAHEMKEWEK